MNQKPSYEEMRDFLLEHGWEMSWSDDNWVRSNAKNKEAMTGINTLSAYKIETNQTGRIYKIRHD